jgi:hypothetical protein
MMFEENKRILLRLQIISKLSWQTYEITFTSGNFFRLKSTWKSTSNIVEMCGNLNSSNIFQIPCDKTRGILGVDPQNLI